MADFLLSAWTMFYTVVLALFLFGISVFVHEFGHFIVARKRGLIVQTFSIGFGKALWNWEKNGVVYKIGWIPFGGYVSLPQLDPAGMERLQGREKNEDFPEVSPWDKMAVAVSGPLGNILFAVLLAVVIWLIPGGDAGVQVRPVIGSIQTNSTAYAAGLRVGDEIFSVDGTVVHNWYEFSVETLLQGSDSVVLSVRSAGIEKEVNLPRTDSSDEAGSLAGIFPAIPCVLGSVAGNSPAEQGGVRVGDEVLGLNGQRVLGWKHFTELVQTVIPGETVRLTVERSGESIELSIAPQYDETYERMMIGVQLDKGSSGMPWMLYRNPLEQLKHDGLAIFRLLKALTTPDEAPQAAKGLGGPIAIFEMLILAMKMGLLNTMGFIRFININLAVINLLPIPVLDGGHILFSLWEGITRRRVHAKVQMILINICAFLLIGAMLLVTFNDINRKIPIKDFLMKRWPGQAQPLEGK